MRNAWVHGDIRHLEIEREQQRKLAEVHGDIRHLEKTG